MLRCSNRSAEFRRNSVRTGLIVRRNTTFGSLTLEHPSDTLSISRTRRVIVDEDLQYEPRPPSPWLSAAEVPRTLAEVTWLLGTWPFLGDLPAGDGHPVLVLPGFAADDESTWFLRRFLTLKRYRAIPWLLGTNTGAADVQERLVRRVYRLMRTYRQPLSLVGQSLGGVFAREMARRFPDQVRQVITLGSPFGATDPASTSPAVLRLFEQMSGMTVEEMQAQMPGEAHPTKPTGVPTTSVFSRSDGVVQWQACIEAETRITQNVEVVASHSGMAMNPAVYCLVADRLAQNTSDWQKFDTSHGIRPWLFPSGAAA